MYFSPSGAVKWKSVHFVVQAAVFHLVLEQESDRAAVYIQYTQEL